MYIQDKDTIDQPESTPMSSLDTRLWLTAFDESSTIVARETHPGYLLFGGGWIELVDEPDSRVKLGVRRIDIDLRESDGTVKAKWSMRYDENGQLSDAFESAPTSGAHPYPIKLPYQFAARLRWVVAPA